MKSKFSKTRAILLIVLTICSVLVFKSFSNVSDINQTTANAKKNADALLHANGRSPSGKANTQNHNKAPAADKVKKDMHIPKAVKNAS